MFSRLIHDIFNLTQTTADCHVPGNQMQKMIDYLRVYIDIDNKAGFNVQQQWHRYYEILYFPNQYMVKLKPLHQETITIGPTSAVPKEIWTLRN